jgi:lysophospholipid acyltransferase (LPLAT)-like uncharacterized protein
MKPFKKFVIFKIVIPLAVFIFKVIASTFRIKEMNADKMTPRQGKGKRYIYAFKHSQLLEHIYFYRHTKMASLASLSKDGEIAAVIAEAFGITMLRGSSSRGGAGALMGLKTLSEQGFDIALTVDGPRGPLGTVNSGVIYLAKLTGVEIVPSCFACDRGIRLRTWDKFLIPKPFSRGLFNFGKPIKVPSDIQESGISGIKDMIRMDLDRINNECEEALKNIYD